MSRAVKHRDGDLWRHRGSENEEGRVIGHLAEERRETKSGGDAEQSEREDDEIDEYGYGIGEEDESAVRTQEYLLEMLKRVLSTEAIA